MRFPFLKKGELSEYTVLPLVLTDGYLVRRKPAFKSLIFYIAHDFGLTDPYYATPTGLKCIANELATDI